MSRSVEWMLPGSHKTRYVDSVLMKREKQETRPFEYSESLNGQQAPCHSQQCLVVGVYILAANTLWFVFDLWKVSTLLKSHYMHSQWYCADLSLECGWYVRCQASYGHTFCTCLAQVQIYSRSLRLVACLIQVQLSMSYTLFLGTMLPFILLLPKSSVTCKGSIARVREGSGIQQSKRQSCVRMGYGTQYPSALLRRQCLDCRDS